jgi:hypothetical protein
MWHSLVLSVWCSKSLLNLIISLARFGKKIAIILLNTLYMTFACSSLESMSHKFGLSMVSQVSYLLHLCIFSFFLNVHLNVLTPPSCLQALIFGLQYDPVYERDFSWVSYLTFHFQNFNLIFFSEFLYVYWIPLSCSAQSSLFSSLFYLSFLGIHSGVYLCSF